MIEMKRKENGRVNSTGVHNVGLESVRSPRTTKLSEKTRPVGQRPAGNSHSPAAAGAGTASRREGLNEPNQSFRRPAAAPVTAGHSLVSPRRGQQSPSHRALPAHEASINGQMEAVASPPRSAVVERRHNGVQPVPARGFQSPSAATARQALTSCRSPPAGHSSLVSPRRREQQSPIQHTLPVSTSGGRLSPASTQQKSTAADSWPRKASLQRVGVQGGPLSITRTPASARKRRPLSAINAGQASITNFFSPGVRVASNILQEVTCASSANNIADATSPGQRPQLSLPSPVLRPAGTGSGVDNINSNFPLISCQLNKESEPVQPQLAGLPKKRGRPPGSKNWGSFAGQFVEKQSVRLKASSLQKENLSSASLNLDTSASSTCFSLTNDSHSQSKRQRVAIRRCCAPLCRNTSTNCDLHFFLLSTVREVRERVFLKIEEDTGFLLTNSRRSSMYFCELHFEKSEYGPEPVFNLDGSVVAKVTVVPGACPTRFIRRNQKGVVSWHVKGCHKFSTCASKCTILSDKQDAAVEPDALTLRSKSREERAVGAVRRLLLTSSSTLDLAPADESFDYDEHIPLEESTSGDASFMDISQVKSLRNSDSEFCQSSRSSSFVSETSAQSDYTTSSSGSKAESLIENEPSHGQSRDKNISQRSVAMPKFLASFKNGFIELMMDSPKDFLGIDKENLKIIDILEKRVDYWRPREAILLTLRRLKLNESLNILAKYFGYSISFVSQLFRKTLVVLEACFQQLIFRPPAKKIVKNLPRAFRVEFYETSEMLDCFEIELQKPSNPLSQSQTWSQYKSCNTAKYLISVTPDGYIVFVSQGFGGRASDVAICKESGYLDSIRELRHPMKLMCDRGFKHLEASLPTNIKMIRPPSVGAGTVLSGEISKYGKKVAALRIHVERAIGRLREYLFICPHSRVPVKQSALLDAAVNVASGLVNLQARLIKV